MSNEAIAIACEEHVRDALRRAEADGPSFSVDSWSETCVRGQFVTLVDDEGVASQACLDHVIRLGVAVRPGSLARSCAALVKAVVAEIDAYAKGADLVVSRPLPDTCRPGVHEAHCDYHNAWLMLTVAPDEEGTVAILEALLGKHIQPLAPAEVQVTWL